MAKDRHLRVYYGPDDSRGVPLTDTNTESSTVQVSLHELLDTVGEAVASNRVWANDFRNEKISISTDLFEIISAYRQMKRAA